MLANDVGNTEQGGVSKQNVGVSADGQELLPKDRNRENTGTKTPIDAVDVERRSPLS